MFEEYLDFAVGMAREAGRIQLSYFRGDDLAMKTKSNVSDVVTRADRESEELIVRRIAERYPTHAVLGEEGSFTRVATPEMTGYVRTERLDVRLAEDMIGARVRVVYPDDPARETTVNLRAEPDLDGRLICQVPTGTEVLWLFDRDEWYIVETDGLRGYMMAQYLEPIE